MITQGGTEAILILALLFLKVIIVSFCNVVFLRHLDHRSFEVCDFVEVHKKRKDEKEKKKQENYFQCSIQKERRRHSCFTRFTSLTSCRTICGCTRVVLDATAITSPICNFCNLVFMRNLCHRSVEMCYFVTVHNKMKNENENKYVTVELIDQHDK